MIPARTPLRRTAGPALAALALALAALAPAPSLADPAAADPERLRLARELLASSGGADAVRAQMRSFSEAAGAALAVSSDPTVRAAMQEAMARGRERALGLVDPIVAAAERIYADALTAAELRDAIAWNESPSGRAIRAKTPEITRRIFAAQAPMMRALFIDAMKDGIRSACASRGCAPADLDAALARVDALFPPSAAAAAPGSPRP